MQLDRIFSRRRNVPPENAHGQRNIDGSYFSIWLCENGHGTVGRPDAPPNRENCHHCTFGENFEKVARCAPVPAQWRLASREEAHAFVFALEGDGVLPGVGFRLL